MAKKVSTHNMKVALARERRTNRRLRAIIDALTDESAHNRRDLDLQFARLAQLQAELDALKHKTSLGVHNTSSPVTNSGAGRMNPRPTLPDTRPVTTTRARVVKQDA